MAGLSSPLRPNNKGGKCVQLCFYLYFSFLCIGKPISFPVSAIVSPALSWGTCRLMQFHAGVPHTLFKTLSQDFHVRCLSMIPLQSRVCHISGLVVYHRAVLYSLVAFHPPSTKTPLDLLYGIMVTAVLIAADKGAPCEQLTR